MPVIENQEPIVPINPKGTKIVLDYEVELGYANQFIARESVVKRLSDASLCLPEGIYLSVKETYRPKSFQSFIYNRRLIQLFCSEKHINLTSQEVHEITAEYIAPPNVAGHPTGGAVDVSLVDRLGNEIDLGCQYDEDATISQGKCYSFCGSLEADVIENRRVLFECMEKAGFINYPFEWWHWSYGDKYWAIVAEAPNAFYSAIEIGHIKAN
ncbi:M15 family metallopeptidase [Vibrio sp. Isolate33]|uniref:M15 family metallopeptidase n=1 Tax=Vibrio sp. Isolate33 TaxID=2908539 RepID=UPI001EFDE2EE|nr:M15 family metallopeptidase [Vibrio sp. Isolate33]MCG9546083.1 M15 family metallopeptidase [Vibrio sp. Isolate33]